MRELHTDGRWQTETHGAETAGVDPAARLVEFVELCGPHLVLADVRGDKRFAACQRVQFLEHILRLDKLALAIIGVAVQPAPFVDLFPPGRECRLVRLFLRAFQLLDHVLEHAVGRAHDRDLDWHVLGDRCRIDVDMNDACIRTEFGQFASHAIIETRAHRQQHVATVHGHVGFIGAVHAEHADGQRVVRREGAEAHERLGDRVTEQAHEFGERLGGLTQHNAAAGVDHRAPGIEQQVDGLFDLSRVALGHRVVRAHGYIFWVVVLAARRRDVLRDIHQHRTGPPGRGNGERLLDGGREVVHILHQDVVLHTGARDAHRVHFLEGIVADEMGCHLGTEHHQRDGIHVGGGDTGHGVRHARAGGHQHHAGAAGGARVAVGRVGRALFVAHQDMLHVLLLVEGVIDMQGGAARIAEHVLDAFILEATDKDLCAGQFHSHGKPRMCNKKCPQTGHCAKNLSERRSYL